MYLFFESYEFWTQVVTERGNRNAVAPFVVSGKCAVLVE